MYAAAAKRDVPLLISTVRFGVDYPQFRRKIVI